jgi:hypothetical protein
MCHRFAYSLCRTKILTDIVDTRRMITYLYLVYLRDDYDMLRINDYLSRKHHTKISLSLVHE